MKNLRVSEIKAFVPAKDFDKSKQFYQEIGFTLASDNAGIAYFYFENVSFLLQDFYEKTLAENFMMHILVEDVESWSTHIHESGVVENYGIKITPVETQPWAMKDFCFTDPSGVLWRVGQNI